MNFDFKSVFNRKKYIDSIKYFLDSNLILVFLGQRRVGKSYMIFQLIKYFLENKIFKEREIFYINKEYFSFDYIKNYEDVKKEFLNWKKENKI
jgi:predicted AAA+ superfamily ATPase